MEKQTKKARSFSKASIQGKRPLAEKSPTYPILDGVNAAAYLICFLIMCIASLAGEEKNWAVFGTSSIFFVPFVIFLALMIRELARPSCYAYADSKTIVLISGESFSWDDVLGATGIRSHYLDPWSFRTYSCGDLILSTKTGSFSFPHIIDVEGTAERIKKQKKRYEEEKAGASRKEAEQ